MVYYNKENGFLMEYSGNGNGVLIEDCKGFKKGYTFAPNMENWVIHQPFKTYYNLLK